VIIRISISLVFLVLVFFKTNAQTYNYSYTDPCTGNIKNIIVPINGTVTVGYYGFIGNFSQQDFSNGNFESWANNIFSQYSGSPCSEIIGLGGQINMAQDVALNTIGIINSLSSLMDLSNGATDFLSGTLTAASNSSNTQEKKGNKKDKNNNNEGNNGSESPSSNAGTSSNNTNTTNTDTGTNINNNQNSNSNQVGGSNSTASNNQNGTNGTGNPNGGSQTNTGSNEGGANNGGTGTSGSNAGNEGQTSTGSTSTQGGSNENGNSQTPTSVTNQNSNSNGTNINNSVNSNPSNSVGNGNTGSGNNGQETTEQTNQEIGSGTTDPNNSSNGGSSGTSSSGSPNGNGNSPNSEESTKPQEEEGGGQTNITQGATKTVNQNREGGKPTVIASSDFVGFNFQNSEVRTGLKLTGGYHNMRWDGETARGGLLDYVSAQKGPNLTGYHAWINKKSVGLLSGTLSVGFEGRGSIYGTLAGGQMFMFPKIPSLKAVYMGTISYGQVYKTPFLGSALIAGGMYDLKFGRRIDVKLMALFVYSPYVSYYNDLVLKSPYVVLPSLGTNISITKRFKFNINAGGAWAIKVNTLNYTITCGTRLLVGQ
jgi:hypothetical protein